MAKLQITPIDERIKTPIPTILDSSKQQTFSVGRDIGNANVNDLDFIISDRTVSKSHCTIEYENAQGSDRWFIRDHSTNGTWVEGVRLDYDRRHKLSGFSDTVICGVNECGFQVDSSITEAGMKRELPEGDSEPTINKTIEQAIADAKSESIDIDNMWEALYHGLRDIPNSRLIIYGLFALSGLVVWLGAEVLRNAGD